MISPMPSQEAGHSSPDAARIIEDLFDIGAGTINRITQHLVGQLSMVILHFLP